MAAPSRLHGFSYTGYSTYFLTFCVINRAAVFHDATNVTSAWSQIQRTATEQGFAVLAYCFMPDHMHLLVEGLKRTSDLQAFAKLAKQRSGGVYARRTGRRLWQHGYHDRVLRSFDEVHRFATYIRENPVRAGLVINAADYPFAGP